MSGKLSYWCMNDASSLPKCSRILSHYFHQWGKMWIKKMEVLREHVVEYEKMSMTEITEFWERTIKLLKFLLVSSSVDQKYVEFSSRLNEIQNLAFNKIVSFHSVFPILQKIKIKINDNWYKWWSNRKWMMVHKQTIMNINNLVWWLREVKLWAKWDWYV